MPNTGRQLLEEFLKEQGATIQRSVTAKTDLVIAGKDPSPSKITEAEKRGVPIVWIK